MNRVKYTTTTTGTGTLTLSLETGFQAYADAPVTTMADSRGQYFLLAANSVDWEYGVGFFSGSTMSRSTVLESTNAGAAINLSAGTHTVIVTKGSIQGMILTCAVEIATPGAITANTGTTIPWDTVLQDDLAILPSSWVLETTAAEFASPQYDWYGPKYNMKAGLFKGWRAHFLVKVPSTATPGSVMLELEIEYDTYYTQTLAAAWAPFINGRANTVSCSTPWIDKPRPNGSFLVWEVDRVQPVIYNNSAASLTPARCEFWMEFRL